MSVKGTLGFLGVTVPFFFCGRLCAPLFSAEAIKGGPIDGLVLKFEDDFESGGTVDFSDDRGVKHNWYRRFFFGNAVTQAGENLSLSKGIVAIGGPGLPGGSLATACPYPNSVGWRGRAWTGGGYFEATIRFDPVSHKMARTKEWPSFWAMSVEHLAGLGADQWQNQPPGFSHFVEVDIFEYDTWSWLGDNTSYGGTVHDWYGTWSRAKPYSNADNQGNGSSLNNMVNMVPVGTKFSEWHRYGVLWKTLTPRSHGELQYYFDGRATQDKVEWSRFSESPPPKETSLFSVLDKQALVLILSTGPNWRVEVKRIAVWQGQTGKELDSE